MSPLSIIICVLGLGILAAVHEIGHFLAAKRLGIKVEELSIFVGPSLFSWKKNGVDYHIRLIPFGAYVRFTGMDEEDGGPENPDSYLNQARWKRLLVSLAGPFMNIVLGIIIFAAVFSGFGFLSTKLDMITEGTQIAETNAAEGDSIISVNGNRILTDLDLSYFFSMASNTEAMTLTLRSQESGDSYTVTLKPTLTSKYMLGIVVDPSTGENGGWKILSVDEEQNGGNPVMKAGDSLVAVNGISVTDPDYADVVSGSGGNELTATIVRGGVLQDVKLSAKIYEEANPRGVYVKAGSGFGGVIRESVLYSVSVIKVSLLSIQDIIQGEIKASDAVAGPVGIATIVSDVVDQPQVDYSAKVQSLGLLAGLISVGLAFTNLLPLPGLDGNALILVVVEMIRGKKISVRTEKIINVLGFIILIALVLFALSSDILRLVG